MVPYPDIDPVAVAFGPITVHWYGLTYLGGLAFAWWLARHRAAQPNAPLQRHQVDDLIFYAAVGIVIGGRLGYTLFTDLIVLSAIHCGCLGSGKVAWRFMVASWACWWR